MSTSQNKKKNENSHYENPDLRKGKNSGGPPEIIRIDGFLPENAIIKSTRKYHPSQTRHVLAISLVISLLIVMIVFGILHAVVDKEMIESLEDFSRYSITILSSLTGAAIGFFFGRDVKDS
jgi:hypothetical protein